MSKLKVAIIGCGAVTERCHLPAVAALEDTEIVMLVDRNRERAEELARKFKVTDVATDYREVIGMADGAIVALPHNLHASVCSDLLAAGVHVLVEKPMALTSRECQEMIDMAHKENAILSVGHMRRFLHSAIFVKAAIESGILGRIEHFDFREGNVYNWPVSSDFFFKRESAGGGVLFDTGAHTLDLLIWWFGEVSLIEYQDDSFGGVESDCEIVLRTASGAEGIVELSRTRNLRNTAIIRGERGRLEVDLRNNRVVFELEGQYGETSLVGHGRTASIFDEPDQGFVDLFPPQIKDFVNAIQNRTTPRCSGAEAAKSVALMEACYSQKKLLAFPWLPVKPKVPEAEFKNKTILVTGGTGFIGGRLIERLALEHGANIKVLVRNFSHASRIARFPVEMIPGDIVDEKAVSVAVEGCDYIFHCAYDFAGDSKHKKMVSVKGTENICKAALEHKVKRLIHVSTFSVYGDVKGDLDEGTQKESTDDAYALTKLAAEELVMEFHRQQDLSAVVLQPTIVYGPFSKPWSINPLIQLSTGIVPLPNNGKGCCNAVYIDDVIDAMFLAALKDEAEGEIFLISGEEPPNWKEFYGALEGVLGKTATVAMSIDDILDLQLKQGSPPVDTEKNGLIRNLISIVRDPYIKTRIATIPTIQTTAIKMRGTFPKLYDYLIIKIFGKRIPKRFDKTEVEKSSQIHVPNKIRMELLSSSTRVSIEKAKKLLGYNPGYDFVKGMKLTEEFLRWANVVEVKEE